MLEVWVGLIFTHGSPTVAQINGKGCWKAKAWFLGRYDLFFGMFCGDHETNKTRCLQMEYFRMRTD